MNKLKKYRLFIQRILTSIGLIFMIVLCVAPFMRDLGILQQKISQESHICNDIATSIDNIIKAQLDKIATHYATKELANTIFHNALIENITAIQGSMDYYAAKDILDSKLENIAKESNATQTESAINLLSDTLYEINANNADSFHSIIGNADILQDMLSKYAFAGASQKLFNDYMIISQATYDTLYMVFFSIIIAIIFGLPLGVLLSITKQARILSMPSLNALISVCVSIVRSFPFIILIVLLLPLSQFLIGTSIGSTAAIIPLGIAAIPFIARLFEGALEEVDKGIIEATLSMGASKLRVVVMMIAEAKPSIINAIIITIIGLIGYSAMAGALGAGGLGDVAIRLGFQGYQSTILFSTVVVIIVLVQLVQGIGDLIIAQIRKKR